MMNKLKVLLDHEYLDARHLSGFDSYKYNARDTSPLSIYVMHPFWNNIVEYFPRWVAPNVMTFVGFLFTALNFVILSWYDWSFTVHSDEESLAPIPNYIWFWASVFIFTAYTLDGIDGKQARRIGLSGPLGELFDHGLDSYTAVLIPACLYSIFGRGESSIPPMRMFYVIWMVFFNFFISHWEKYNTGVLYLPWGYDLSMWGSTLMYFVTWAGSYKIWKHSLPFGITLGLVMECVLHISALSSVPMVVYNTYMSYKEKTGKMRSPMEAVRPLIPFVTHMILFLYWAHMSPGNIIETDPRALYLLSGTIFSNISCRLIVAQMSNTRSEIIHWMTPIFIGSVFICMYVPIFERLILYLLCIITTLTHWHYGSKVVQQMCVHFKRICFKVTPPPVSNDTATPTKKLS